MSASTPQIGGGEDAATHAMFAKEQLRRASEHTLLMKTLEDTKKRAEEAEATANKRVAEMEAQAQALAAKNAETEKQLAALTAQAEAQAQALSGYSELIAKVDAERESAFAAHMEPLKEMLVDGGTAEDTVPKCVEMCKDIYMAHDPVGQSLITASIKAHGRRSDMEALRLENERQRNTIKALEEAVSKSAQSLDDDYSRRFQPRKRPATNEPSPGAAAVLPPGIPSNIAAFLERNKPRSYCGFTSVAGGGGIAEATASSSSMVVASAVAPAVAAPAGSAGESAVAPAVGDYWAMRNGAVGPR